MSKFFSTKTYGNEEGLSCVFRQWRSTHSHCSTLHGYSIGMELVFSCSELDERNWVYDFGGLKEFKVWMHYMFDHTMIVTEDDPFLNEFKRLANLGIATGSGTGEFDECKPHERGALVDLRIVQAVGCEKFAEMAWQKMNSIIRKQIDDGLALNPSVKIHSVKVFEHGANSATYEG